MDSTDMRRRLQRGEVLLGLATAYPAPGIIEGMCRGWDFVWIDGQHGQYSHRTAPRAVRSAASIGVFSVLRAPGQAPGVLARYADASPSCLMVPMVNNAREAAAIIRAVQAGGGVSEHEHGPLILAQIENAGAVERATDIIGTKGVDGLFFSGADLRVSSGIALATPTDEHEDLRRWMERVAEVARACGKFAGCVVGDADAARTAVGIGYQLLGGGSDIRFLATAPAERLAELRGVLSGREG